jgi:choline dehydrogenase
MSIQALNATYTDFDLRVKDMQRKLAENLGVNYDYIICGAGTSGSVLAARLCEDSRVRVLLLESGGSDESNLIDDPNLWVAALGTSFDWGYVAEPNPQLNGRAIAYSMGKGLGGDRA